ncbi:MAG: helix-turn-helix domain-containing protein [Breznakibacter sp.]
MKDSVFTDSDKYTIPSFDLMHRSQKVEFAFRTMEYIFDKTQGRADVPHRHNYYTVLWVKRAEGKHIVDYREHDLGSDKVFFVSPGQVHQVITTSRPLGVAIMFTCDFLNKNHINRDFITNLGLFSDFPDTPPIQTNLFVNAKLQMITEQIGVAFESEEHFRSETIGAWLKLFLIECNKLMENRPLQNPQALQSGRAILIDFKRLVEENYVQWHKVGDYAAQLSISPDYLNNVIKSNIGTTAKDYIQNRLVTEAKRLGLVTQLSSKEIAFSLGFEDPAHFSRFFKNVEGISFSEFRADVQIQVGTG